jgi:hypothetical protein
LLIAKERNYVFTYVCIRCEKVSGGDANHLDTGTETDVMISKIFSPKNLRKCCIFYSKQRKIMKKFDHNGGF